MSNDYQVNGQGKVLNNGRVVGNYDSSTDQMKSFSGEVLGYGGRSALGIDSNDLYSNNSSVENSEFANPSEAYARDDWEVWHFTPFWCALVVSMLIVAFMGIKVYEGTGLILTIVQIPIWYFIFYFLMNKDQIAYNKREKEKDEKHKEFIKNNPEKKYRAEFVESIDKTISDEERKLYYLKEGLEEDGISTIDPRIKNRRIRSTKESIEFYKACRDEMYELGLKKIESER